MVLLFSCNTSKYILFSSNGIDNESSNILKFKRINFPLAKDSVTVHFEDKTKFKIHADSIWGIKYNNYVYRYFKRKTFLIRAKEELVIYSNLHGGYKSSHTDYFFSKTLNDDIFRLNGKSIKENFEQDTCFLKAIELDFKWYQDYSKFDRKTKTFKIIEIYKNCKK